MKNEFKVGEKYLIGSTGKVVVIKKKVLKDSSIVEDESGNRKMVFDNVLVYNNKLINQ